MALSVALAFPQSALALPTGETVVSGTVGVTRPSAQQMVVQQGSDKAIVNWQGFSIGGAEAVTFQQPGAASVILNRVVGGDPSSILGRMTANGKVFLVNPGGVFFAPGASVDVGGLVASTLSISNEDFLAGRYRFVASGAAAVSNQGTLRAADGGTVALLGAQVSNDGTITAKLGTVALAAGNRVSLDFAGDGLTKVTVDEAAVGAQVRNSGMIIADGGQAVLTAHAAQALTDTVVNQTGVVRARSLAQRNGRIVLDGGDEGVTQVSGTLDTSGKAAGETGGEIQVMGHDVGIIEQARIDASGDAGGGTVLIGGDYQGKNPLVRNAAATYFGPDAVINADAISNGNGGQVIVWADDTTRAYGAISARGGVSGGDGGFVETSGRFLDTTGIHVDASASNGVAGQWLLDPANVTIAAPPAITTNPGFLPNYFSEVASSTVSTADIESALNAGTSVSIITDDPSSGLPVGQPGDITVAASIAKTAGASADLLLDADNSIVIAAGVGITATGSGGLNVTLVARNGDVVMNTGTTIQSNGGLIQLRMNGTGGNFKNIGGGTLVPGPGGHWEIWQTTWVGEVRGGLNPGNPMPNIYGCSYSAECSPPDDTNNYYLYVDRPTALVVADDKLKTFGDPNPPLTFTVQGLINGDTAGDAVAGGALGTTATQFSAIGVYPIFDATPSNAPITSPAGYIIDTQSIVPGLLAIQGIPDKGPYKVPANNETGIYDRNLGLPHMCVATGPLAIQTAMQGADLLDVEWSRVRQKPNVSNCIALGEHNTCDSF